MQLLCLFEHSSENKTEVLEAAVVLVCAAVQGERAHGRNSGWEYDSPLL